MDAAKELRKLELAAAKRALRQAVANCRILALSVGKGDDANDLELLRSTIRLLSLCVKIIDS